ncbi:MAG: hypothetical protein CMM05_03315 [Rhodopirellula sp.]|nr:hypothetical protein [Rhodopirellula sp.]
MFSSAKIGLLLIVAATGLVQLIARRCVQPSLLLLLTDSRFESVVMGGWAVRLCARMHVCGILLATTRRIKVSTRLVLDCVGAHQYF